MIKFGSLFLLYVFYLVADIVGAIRVLSAAAAAASPPQLRHVELDPPPGREGVT